MAATDSSLAHVGFTTKSFTGTEPGIRRPLNRRWLRGRTTYLRIDASASRLFLLAVSDWEPRVSPCCHGDPADVDAGNGRWTLSYVSRDADERTATPDPNMHGPIDPETARPACLRQRQRQIPSRKAGADLASAADNFRIHLAQDFRVLAGIVSIAPSLEAMGQAARR